MSFVERVLHQLRIFLVYKSKKNNFIQIILKMIYLLYCAYNFSVANKNKIILVKLLRIKM